MCGIVGYIGKKPAVPVLINGLKALEYRGYDSAGVCVCTNGKLVTIKRKGKVVELEKAISNFELQISNSCMGIAHTRWATHGKPNEINSHPHLDCSEEVAIVHNGIIENYEALKELLKKEGHNIVSETDSEVVVHLVEKFLKENGGILENAVVKTLALLEGTYGLLIMNAKTNELVAAKKSSPLILGLGRNEMYVASDVAALLPYTKKVVYLEDGEVAVVKENGYVIKNVKGKILDKKIARIKWDIGQIEKKGYKHFMLKEIMEQPQSIENTLRGRLVNGRVKLSIVSLKNVKRIIITACGTSWHSALIGKYVIEKVAGIPVEVDYASEYRYRNPIVRQDDLMIVMSQSGETADTLAALSEAKSKGARTLGIVNVVGSTIAREVDSGIYLHAGPEIGVASTKAFTCQVTALVLLALQLSGKAHKNIVKELQELPIKVEEALAQAIKKIAAKFKDAKNFLYLGRNVNFPVALEGALKLKEISYIHAEGYPAAEMKHGPIALIDEHMPVVFVAPQDDTYNKILSNMEEIKARGGKVIAIINKDDAKIKRLADYVIKVPATADMLSPIINVLPLQLLAYYIADLKGLNVDKPRNLAKSVTVE